MAYLLFQIKKFSFFKIIFVSAVSTKPFVKKNKKKTKNLELMNYSKRWDFFNIYKDYYIAEYVLSILDVFSIIT